MRDPFFSAMHVVSYGVKDHGALGPLLVMTFHILIRKQEEAWQLNDVGYVM